MDGGCLCSTVRWRVAGELPPLAHCHCSTCRKSHGTAFATYLTVTPEAFEWVAGEEAVTWYESSPGFRRAFCSRCGSVVPGVAADGHVFAPAGGLDGDPAAQPGIHIFVASKAPWFELTDDLRRYDASPRGPERVHTPPRGAERPGSTGGSCACGAVAFELDAPLATVRNCHCGRCRKARAAAHATNGFLGIDQIRFTRGEGNLSTFELPQARFFAQAFCRACGSPMPRLDPERGIAVVPLGSLDDDPGRGPSEHIYTAFRAPWHQITDALPQHPDRPPA